MLTYDKRLKIYTIDLFPVSQKWVKCLSVNAKKAGNFPPIIVSVVNKTGRRVIQYLFGNHSLAHHF